jgi:hypothetical protein
VNIEAMKHTFKDEQKRKRKSAQDNFSIVDLWLLTISVAMVACFCNPVSG